MNIYKEEGYESRNHYLITLTDDYAVDRETVYALAEVLGEDEDFDGLISALEDFDSDIFE